MVDQTNNRITIILESSNDFLEDHPLIKSHNFIHQSDLSGSLQEEIAFIHKQEMSRHIVYLYEFSHKKQQALMKLRNLFLPELNILPLPFPENDAEIVHLLFLVSSNQEKTFNETLFAWNVVKRQMTCLLIQHGNIKKVMKGRKTPVAEDKYILYQNDQKQKEIRKGYLSELIEKTANHISGYKPLIIQETADKKYYFWKSIDELRQIKDTIRISICAVKIIGVESNG